MDKRGGGSRRGRVLLNWGSYNSVVIRWVTCRWGWINVVGVVAEGGFC